MLCYVPQQLTVNHVVVSTTAHKMWPQQKAAGKVRSKMKISQFHKMKKKILSDNTSVTRLKPFGMLYTPTHCRGLLHDSPELSTTCLTLIRACQLE